MASLCLRDYVRVPIQAPVCSLNIREPRRLLNSVSNKGSLSNAFPGQDFIMHGQLATGQSQWPPFVKLQKVDLPGLGGILPETDDIRT